MGLDIDLDLDGCPARFHGGQPLAQHRLQMHVAVGLDQESAPVTAAQHRQRRRCGTQYGDAAQMRCRPRNGGGGAQRNRPAS